MVFRIAVLIFGLAGTTPLGAQPVVYRVGAFGLPCTHATLDAAIADASGALFGSTVIKLANNQVYNSVNVNIAGKNLTLEGGYADCVASRPVSGARTALIGTVGAGDSVIEIIGGVSQRQVVLRDLEIHGGEPDTGGGAGVEIDGNAIVTFEDLIIRDNSAGGGEGGGVHLSGTPDPSELRVVGGTTHVGDGNEATLGGGIYCDTASIEVDGELRVESNRVDEAIGEGGGLYLRDCDLTVGNLFADTAELHVNYNEAYRGGGLAANSGSQILLRGATHSVHANDAVRLGGGIELSGAQTVMWADNTSVSGNAVLDADDSQANNNVFGGGLFVGDGALADFDGGLLQPCAQFFNYPPPGDPVAELACVRFRSNSAATADPLSTASGGAIYVTGAELRLRQARIVDNSADVGTAVVANGSEAQVLLESVIIDRNYPGQRALKFGSGVDATVAFATIVNASDGTFPIAVADQGTILKLHASVMALDPATVEVDSEALVQVSCLMGPANSAVPTIATSSGTDFVDAYGDEPDYRPSDGSALIDRCNDTPYAPTSRDAIGVLRPVDDADEANSPGPYDVGAFERQPDVVFADSFESAP